MFSSSGNFLKYLDLQSILNIPIKGQIVLDEMALDRTTNESIYVLGQVDNSRGKIIYEISKKGELESFFNIPFLTPNKLLYGQGFVFLPENGYYGDYLIYKYSKYGNLVSAFGEISDKTDKRNRISRKSENDVNLASDKNGNIFVAYRFKPKVKKYSIEGESLLEFEYDPVINNKKSPVVGVLLSKETIYREQTEEGGIAVGKFAFGLEEYPVCYDIVVDNEGNIFLLVAKDHKKKESCDLYKFDQSGKFIEKCELPVPCTKVLIDNSNNFYFLSPSMTRLVYKFSPLKIPSEKSALAADSEKSLDSGYLLGEILHKTSNYCERLKKASVDFVCLEEIKERVSYARGAYRFFKENNYIYDYQLVRKDNRITERRNLLQENKEKKFEKEARLKTSVIDYKHAIFGPIGLLSEHNQSQHNYCIIDEQIEHNGEKALIIEAVPKKQIRDSEHLFGNIWIRKDDFSILKIEWAQESFGNFEVIEKKAKELNARPLIISSSEYGYDKNGIRFPSKFHVKEIYIGRKGKRLLASETIVIYKNYKFFTVETDVTFK